MSYPRGTSLTFGSFSLDPDQRVVTHQSRAVAFTPKEFDTLLTLVQARGRVVTKEELLRRIWPDSYVGDGSLARNISVIRKALGEDVIETIPRRGYRLVLAVEETQASTELVPVAQNPQPPEVNTSSEADLQPVLPGNQGNSFSPRPLGGHSRLLAYAALVVVIAVVVLILNRTSVSHAKVATPQWPVRIAVLPFANYTGNSQNDYLCDGITEATISELSRLKPDQLSVIARTSAMKFKSTDKTIPQIAKELNADYILESSIRGSNDRIRITTQLVRGSDASHVWTGEYERNAQSVLDVQEEVAGAVAEEIRLSVDASVRKQLRNGRSVDPEAYQDYLLGRFQWNKRTREGLFKSVEYFEKAIQRDPGYANAYAGLADSYLVLGGGYLPDIETYNKARAAALKALALDNTLSDAYTSLAYEKYVNEHDMPGADEDYQRALMLDPNNANAHHWYAIYLSGMKRSDEAIAQIRRALELDPLAIAIRYNAAWVYMGAERYDDAIMLAKQSVELDGNCAPAHGTLGSAYQANGMYEKAIEEFETAQKLRASYSPYAVEVAHTYAVQGNKEKARTLLASLLSDRHWGDVAPESFALTYAALGQKDDAFRWLKRCADDHSCTAFEFNNRELDPLRSDPRFAQIAR